MRCYPSLSTITDCQADKRIEDGIPVWKFHIHVLLKFCPTVLSCWLLTVTHLGKSVVAFHSVRESKAPDQTRFWAPMDPREESVMSWNNIFLPLPHWAIRFGLVYTRFWCENDLLRTFRVALIEAKPLITATFSSDWAQDILRGLVGSGIQDQCITTLNVQWIQQRDGMDEDDVKTQTRHELPEPKSAQKNFWNRESIE